MPCGGGLQAPAQHWKDGGGGGVGGGSSSDEQLQRDAPLPNTGEVGGGVGGLDR